MTNLQPRCFARMVFFCSGGTLFMFPHQTRSRFGRSYSGEMSVTSPSLVRFRSRSSVSPASGERSVTGVWKHSR